MSRLVPQVIPRQCRQSVACERRRISGRRYTLGWREATKGNMSGFAGYRVICGSIKLFHSPNRKYLFASMNV